MSTTVSAIVANTQEKKFTERVVVPVDQVVACRNWTDAFKLSFAVSGLSLQQLAGNLGMSESALSRILGRGSDEDRRWMPHDRVIPFMSACGNSVPLQWLQLQWQALTGQTVTGVVAADVLHLNDRLDAIEADIHLILNEMRKPVNVLDCSLSASGRKVWLMMDLVDLETMLHRGKV